MSENRGAGLRENFLRLQSNLDSFFQAGGGGKEDFRSFCYRLLRNFENEIVKNRNQITKLKSEISFCEATMKACETQANLIVSMVTIMANTQKKGLAQEKAKKQEDYFGDRPLTDKEMLEKVCSCLCQDEEDMAKCDCPCHDGKPCGNEECKVCYSPDKSGKIIVLRDKAKKKTKKKTSTKKTSKRKKKCPEESQTKTSKTDLSSMPKNSPQTEPQSTTPGSQ